MSRLSNLEATCMHELPGRTSGFREKTQPLGHVIFFLARHLKTRETCDGSTRLPIQL